MRITARILAAAAFVAMATAASAADLRPAYKAPAPVAVAAYNWSGFYIGAHGGYGWGELNQNVFGTTNARDIDGFFGGGQIGWNWQAAGSPWVFGVEADISFGDIGSFTSVPGLGSVSTEVKTFGTARARLGYAVDRALWYLTGGFAWVENDVNTTLLGFGSFDSSNTHVGWTIGGGVEFALWDAWTAKVEYLYIDTESKHYHTDIVGQGLELDPDFHSVRFGLNYRFGGGKGPVVAKY
jgi:outer membrane immunogenic protein